MEEHVVQFERHVAQPVAPSSAGADAWRKPAESLKRSMSLARAGTFLGLALLVAFITNRAGLGLGGALCVFFGLLPVLWAGSWIAAVGALLLQARRLAREGAFPTSTKSTVPTLRRETVRLTQAADALEVAFDDGERRRSDRWPWGEVALSRPNGDVVFRRGGDYLQAPVEVFGGVERADAFARAASERIELSRRQ